MASGSGTVTRRDGVVEEKLRKNKHNSTYETVYAHMKAFAKGVKEGKKLSKDKLLDTLAQQDYPPVHILHYEVIVNGKKVNSQKLKLPSGKILKGEARKIFELERIKTDLRMAEIK